jgi:hypothetical protein
VLGVTDIEGVTGGGGVDEPEEPPPQAATHRHVAEIVAKITSRSKDFISLPPNIYLHLFAKATSLPHNRAGSCYCSVSGF